MGPRTDDRPTLVATVDPARCVSCGICAGSCAPMGVGPAGRTGRDQLADLVSALPRLAPTPADFPVAVLHCAQADPASLRRLAEAPVRFHAVPCVGALHSSVIEILLRQGAAGVVVAGCPPRDCASREGPKWLDARLFHDREAELQPRVDRRRVRVVTLAAGLAAHSLEEVSRFCEEVRRLGAPALEGHVSAEAVCEPPVAPARAGDGVVRRLLHRARRAER